MPKISVIVPVYNDGRYIKQCIRSLISQVDVEKEILIIYDEGSKDNSYEEIIGFKNVENVRIFSVPHCTIGKALNFGLSKAQGEIIAYAEADKEYFPIWLKIAVEYLQTHPNVKAVGTLSTYPKPITFLGRCMIESKKIRKERYKKGKIPMHWAYIYRKDILLQIGGWNENLVVAEDKEIARRIMQAGHEIHLIPIETDIHHSSGIYESWASMLRRALFFGRMHGSKKPQVNKFPWRIFFVIFGGFSFLILGTIFNSLIAILIGFSLFLSEYVARLLWYTYWGWKVVNKKYLPLLPIFGIIIYVPYLVGRIIGMIRR